MASSVRALGLVVRDRRTAAGLSVADFAKKCGLGDATIFRIEYGRVDSISQTTLEALAKGLGTTAGRLLVSAEREDADHPRRKPKRHPKGLVKTK